MKKATSGRATQTNEEINTDITNSLDSVMSVSYTRPMSLKGPIFQAMWERLQHDATRMQKIESRLRELAAAYNEFVDLRDETSRRKQQIERILGLLAPVLDESGKALASHHADSDPETLRAQLPLWEAMKEYLSFVPEARISEMEKFFQYVDFKEGNRQAIESALKRHPEAFKTRKKKQEKFVSLRS